MTLRNACKRFEIPKGRKKSAFKAVGRKKRCNMISKKRVRIAKKVKGGEDKILGDILVKFHGMKVDEPSRKKVSERTTTELHQKFATPKTDGRFLKNTCRQCMKHFPNNRTWRDHCFRQRECSHCKTKFRTKCELEEHLSTTGHRTIRFRNEHTVHTWTPAFNAPVNIVASDSAVPSIAPPSFNAPANIVARNGAVPFIAPVHNGGGPPCVVEKHMATLKAELAREKEEQELLNDGNGNIYPPLTMEDMEAMAECENEFLKEDDRP